MVVNPREEVDSLVTVKGFGSMLPYPDRFLDEPSPFVLFSIFYLGLVPSNDVVFRHMICNSRFVRLSRDGSFLLCSCVGFLGCLFRPVLSSFKSCAKLSRCFPDVRFIAIETRDFIDAFSRLGDVPLIFGVDKNVSQCWVRFKRRADTVFFENPLDSL